MANFNNSTKTKSVCNVCHRKIPAETFQKNGKILIKKRCEQHGSFISDHIWDDPEIFQRFSETKSIETDPAQMSIILTYRCNMDCPVCLANANKLDIPDFNVKDFKRIDHYKSILLTGGEPTIRKDLPQIINFLRKKKKKVVMLSNGIKLADRSYVRLLKQSGLSCVRLQFDSLDDQDNIYMRGKKCFSTKEAAIKNLEDYKIPIILSAVMLKNKSFRGMEKLFNFAFKHPRIRMISVNPLWKLGRYNEEDFVPSSKIIQEADRILGLKKRDWIESTILLVNLDKLLSIFTKRRRFFCMCNVKCLLIRQKNSFIPITRIFNVKKINEKIENIYQSKGLAKKLGILTALLANQLVVNFFTNKNFRFLLGKMLSNSKYLLKRDYLLLNPFYYLSVESFMATENFDFNVGSKCNLHGYFPGDPVPRPACLNRINLMEKE